MTENLQPTIFTGATTIKETDDYELVRLEDGTYKKKMKYQPYHSRVAVTPEEKIELFNVFNDDTNDIVVPLKNMVKKQFAIAHVFTQPYESLDEETGELSYGVTTTFQDTEGNYYATSSKTVYYAVMNIMQTFGKPTDPNYKPIQVEVTGTKQQRGVQIGLKLIGIEE